MARICPTHSVTQRPSVDCKALRWLWFERDSIATIGGCEGAGLHGPTGHLQGPLLGLVPADEAAGMDEDAALDPTEVRERLVPDAAPLLQQREPAAGEGRVDWATHPRILIYVPVKEHSYGWVVAFEYYKVKKIRKWEISFMNTKLLHSCYLLN